jgi:RHS repeat-associated protein
VVAKYEYDGLARRVKKHLDSQSPASPNGIDAYIHYFYNGAWQVLETRRSTSENTGPESLQPQHQYVWSLRYIDAPVLRDENTDTDGTCDDGRIYYLGDANFNVTSLVNTTGDAIERYVYSPYGVLTIYDASWSNIRSASSYDVEYTYTGRRLDGETGLFYYRHRMYAALLGRFISRDPIGYHGDQWSLFRYVGSAPTVSADPTGLEEFPTGCTGGLVSGSAARGHVNCEVVCQCRNGTSIVGTVPVRAGFLAEQRCHDTAESFEFLRICPDCDDDDGPGGPPVPPSRPGGGRERLGGDRGEPVRLPPRRIPPVEVPPDYVVAPCVAFGVGVGIIIIDIITCPSGEGLIGVGMCCRALAL